MNTEDFDFFVRVAHFGSISLAAKEADISVSMASQRIQRLESNLKLRLFYRTTRKLSLTDEARILLEQGFPLLEQFQDLHSQLIQHENTLTGILKVTASATFGHQILTKIIAEFLKLHPHLTLNLDLNDQNVDIIAQSIDVAIRIGHLKDSNLVAKPLTLNPRLLCASPDYLQQFGYPKNLQDLTLHQCLIQNHQHGLTHTWTFIDQANQRQEVRVNGQFITNSGEGIRQAALSGLGISNHSLWHVKADIASGKLVHVLKEHVVEPSQIYAVVSNRKLMPPKVKLFIDFLVDYFKKHSMDEL